MTVRSVTQYRSLYFTLGWCHGEAGTRQIGAPRLSWPPGVSSALGGLPGSRVTADQSSKLYIATVGSLG